MLEKRIRRCKECGKYCEVPKMKTVFRCDECKNKYEKTHDKYGHLINNKKENWCKKCGKKFKKPEGSRRYICYECTEKLLKKR